MVQILWTTSVCTVTPVILSAGSHRIGIISALASLISMAMAECMNTEEMMDQVALGLS